MHVRDDVQTFELDYGMFDGPSQLCVHVVDTGEATVQFGSGHESTAEQAADLALEHDIDVVVAEHGDGDHFGGFDAIVEAFEAEGRNPPERAVPEGDLDMLADAGVEVDRGLEPDREYWGVRTIDAPGHTPGNFAYLYGDVLIAGDTLIGSDFAPIADDPWSGAFGIAPPSRNTGGDDAAIRSVEVLLDYDFETVLVSHGSNALSDGRTEVEALVSDLAGGIERQEF